MSPFCGPLGAAILWAVGTWANASAPPPKPSALPPWAAVPEQSYERWRPPAGLSDGERQVLHAVRAYGHGRGARLAYDWRLGAAAQQLLPWAEGHAGEPMEVDTLRALAWQEGWTDGELAAVVVTSPAAEASAAVVREFRALDDLGEGAYQVGLAVAVGPSAGCRAADCHTVVVGLSRRLVALAPVPAKARAGSDVVLLGHVLAKKIRSATLAMTCPGGEVVQQKLALLRGYFTAPIRLGATPGRLQVQLLVERGRGPEVAAAFPLQVQNAAEAGLDGDGSPNENNEKVGATAAPTGQRPGDLLALLYGLRAAHDLPLPAPTPTLMRVAQSHAADMAQHRFFGHASKQSGNVTHRLAKLQQPFVHVVENIAEGSGPDALFAQWIQSPSHLSNLLDPRVNAVGLATVPSGTAGAYLAVLVMATLAPP